MPCPLKYAEKSCFTPADDVRRRTGRSPAPVSQIESAWGVGAAGGHAQPAPEDPIASGFNPTVGQTHFGLVTDS
jgi:hypothetical protein